MAQFGSAAAVAVAVMAAAAAGRGAHCVCAPALHLQCLGLVIRLGLDVPTKADQLNPAALGIHLVDGVLAAGWAGIRAPSDARARAGRRAVAGAAQRKLSEQLSVSSCAAGPA